MTSREGVHWNNQIQFYATYTNGRKNPVAKESLTFNAAGQMTHSGFTTDNYNWQDTVYDAAGRAEAFYGSARGKAGSIHNTVTERKFEQYSDGDGRQCWKDSDQNCAIAILTIFHIG